MANSQTTRAGYDRKAEHCNRLLFTVVGTVYCRALELEEVTRRKTSDQFLRGKGILIWNHRGGRGNYRSAVIIAGLLCRPMHIA